MTVTCTCITQKGEATPIENQENCDQCAIVCKERDLGTQKPVCMKYIPFYGYNLWSIFIYCSMVIWFFMLMYVCLTIISKKNKKQPKWLVPITIFILFLWISLVWYPPSALIFFLILLTILVMNYYKK